ncbi:metal-nicotianamine transporter YSL3 isoform X4 [Populus trichocarpa]|nr:metal-nicotianamine transporter YSL3 isoform X4 [Populus trichocarpa]|eukprot:XP_024438305.1 metal-nicotianamine transporter YSL3 isoform X4 [Populus trichocarpa]
MNMNMEEMKEIERVGGEGMEEVRDEPEDIKRIAPWTKQITVRGRGIVASIAIGIIYSVIVMKLNLTTGLVPNLNVSAALLTFVFLITWSGFGSYLLGLNRKTYEQAGVDTEGNTPGSTGEPGIGWMTGFLFVSSFVGLLALVPLRKV